MYNVNTHGLTMKRLDIVAQESKVLGGQGPYGNHNFQIFYDYVDGVVSCEEHIGDSYAPAGRDEICVGYIYHPIKRQELADMIWKQMQQQGTTI